MDLAREVGRTARERGRTIALAESITGGLAGSLVTDVPGSSDYFLASFVTYSNDSKMKVLGVRQSTIEKHGAVSAPVAKEMASGARSIAGADIGASCTGIAGPGGGSEGKPVGLVFLAVDDGRRVRSERKVFCGDRWAIKSQTAVRLLELVLRALES
ncbi:MAG TPA: CinA family protein [Methanomassiliicoccales archaeon]|nr:CinA family protein [Methanomassiliicoccales archaeon]